MNIPINEQSVIVFDLDDTLYNETEYLRSAYIEIAKKTDYKNWKPLFAKMFSLYRNGLDVFEYVSLAYGLSKGKLLTTYRNHDPIIHPFNGVLETFSRIKQKNGRVCIITDGRTVTQQKKIKALGLLEYIDKLVISEATGFEKPEENNFRIIEGSFPNNNYWYVADNMRKDFISPNRMGWNTLALIDNGLNIHHKGYLHFDGVYLPQHFVLSFKEIHIV